MLKQEAQSNPILKIEYNKKKFIIQKNIFPKNFEELVKLFEIKFNLQKIPQINYPNLELYYLDLENDTITISNDEDIKFINLNQNLLLSQKGTSSNITITLQENPLIIKENKQQKYPLQNLENNQQQIQFNDDDDEEEFEIIKKEQSHLRKQSSDFIVISNIHHNINCDICQVQSIQGIRYKCKQCINTNLCEKCYALNAHPHNFEKIEDPIEYNKQQQNLQQMKGFKSQIKEQSPPQKGNFDIVFPFLKDKENFVREQLQDYSLQDLTNILDLYNKVNDYLQKKKQNLAFIQQVDIQNQCLVICAQFYTINQKKEPQNLFELTLQQVKSYNEQIQSTYSKKILSISFQLSEILEIRPEKLYEFAKEFQKKPLEELAEMILNDPKIIEKYPNKLKF